MLSRSRLVAVGAAIIAAGCSGSDGAQGPAGRDADPKVGGIISSTPVTTTPDPIPRVLRAVPGTPSCDGVTNMQFFGLTGTVSALAANQKIVVSGGFDLGGPGNTAATNLTLGVCYQVVAANGAPVSAVVPTRGSRSGTPTGSCPSRPTTTPASRSPSRRCSRTRIPRSSS
jgi:hypothetical protein